MCSKSNYVGINLRGVSFEDIPKGSFLVKEGETTHAIQYYNIGLQI